VRVSLPNSRLQAAIDSAEEVEAAIDSAEVTRSRNTPYKPDIHLYPLYTLDLYLDR